MVQILPLLPNNDWLALTHQLENKDLFYWQIDERCCIMWLNIQVLFLFFLLMFSVWLCSHRTQEALKTGHFVSVLQVLMQLQRVCNHPELVAPRENSSSYFCSSLQYNVPSLVLGALQDDSDLVNTVSSYCLNKKLHHYVYISVGTHPEYQS